jgi:hydantoinase/carbamoylase family amidase
MGHEPSKWVPQADRLQQNLQTLAEFGALPDGSLDRQAFSKSYRDATLWLSEEMLSAGLTVRQDHAGNLIGRIGPEGPAILCGSHIDTVPRGGTLDGALGVLAGLECARALKTNETRMNLAFEVVAFADEEGAFIGLLGSRAMTGLLSQETVDHARNRSGLLLSQAMTDYGLDPKGVLAARREPTEIAGYIELHIEQGPVLEAEDIDIGIVDAVVGISTVHHQLIGQANHSGTTPMVRRRDALRAAAAAVTRCFEALESGDLSLSRTINFGQLELESGATNVVPKLIRLTQEIRSTVTSCIETFQDDCNFIFGETARQFGVEHIWHQGDFDHPAPMSEEVQARVREACSRLGVSFKVMPSGAGHDAQLFVDICPTGMIFVPSQGGISHSPAEFTSARNISWGLQVLYTTVHSWVMPTVS